jgi:hemoglobin
MAESHRAEGCALRSESPLDHDASSVSGVPGQIVATAYDRIGGEPAVSGVVEQFFELVLADLQLRSFFVIDPGQGIAEERADLGEIRHHFSTLIATMLGAQVRYEGRNLAEAHRHLGITAADYDRMGDLFLETLRFNDVPEDIVCVVAEKVAALKPLIVEIVRSTS